MALGIQEKVKLHFNRRNNTVTQHKTSCPFTHNQKDSHGEWNTVNKDQAKIVISESGYKIKTCSYCS